MGGQETEDGYNASLQPDPYGIGLQNIHAQGDFNGDGRTDFLYGPVDEYGRIRNALLDEHNICFSMEDGTLDCDTFVPAVYTSRVLAQGDFNDDGKTDLVIGQTDKYGFFSSQNGYILTSNGDGTFNTASFQFALYSYHKVISVGDYNGDGLTDFITARSDKEGRIMFWEYGDYGLMVAYPAYKYLADGSGNFTAVQITTGNMYNPGNYEIPVTSLAPGKVYTTQGTGDFNGDGKSDVFLIYSDEYHRYKTVSPPYQSKMLWLTGSDGAFDLVFPQLELIVKDRVHALGDYNGDGLTDLLIGEADGYGRFKDDSSVTTDQMKVCINQASGVFISTEINVGYQHFCYLGICFDYPVNGIDLKIVSQGDFNGDGLSDFCIAQTNSEGSIVNPATYSYTHYAKGDGLFRPGYSPLDFTGGYGPRVHGDFNGDGKSDFLLANIDGSTGMLDPADFYMFHSKPVIPDLLSTISNSRGDETEIAYTPSTQYDQGENPRPPFVVQTVSSITVSDGMGHSYLSQFSYGDALFDFEDRDFRGFKWAKRINPDGTTEKTGFLQGEFDKGRQHTVEFRESDDDIDASLLNKTIFLWEGQNIGDDARFVYLHEKTNQLWEGGAATVETMEAYEYSDYVTDHENAHGGIKTLTTSIVSGGQGETAITAKEYGNKGSSGGWIWRMTKETLKNSADSPVRKTVYEYEMDTGNLFAKTLCLDFENETGPRTTYTYDSYGNMITMTEPRGYEFPNSPEDFTTTTIYDTSTQTYPVEIHFPQTGVEPNLIDHIVYKQYDYRFGAIDLETDEGLNQTNYDYDQFGRLSEVATFSQAPQLVAQITYAYSFYVDAAHPNYTQTSVKETDTSTINRREYFDGLGRSLSTVGLGASGQTTRTLNTYDEMGRIWKITGPFFNPGTGFDYIPTPPSGNWPITETYYDKRGRPIEISSNDTVYVSNPTSFTYAGFSTTITDPDGKQKTERKDYLGRLIQVVEYNNAEQYTTTYAYNVAGDLLSVTDHLGGTSTTMTYDNLGRKTAMTDPDMGSWAYTYDDNGNLVSQTDAETQTISFIYDALNRVLTKTYSTSDPTVTYTYDNLLIPNGRGKLASVTNTNVTTVYNEYDAMGRGRLITKAISGDSARTTRYDYDLSGKLTHIGYPGTTGQPDGFQVNYAYYPGTGLLQTVTGSDLVEYSRFMSYTASGKISRLETQHGTASHTVTTYAYDDKSTRLTEIVTTDKNNGDVQRKSYTYSQAGDIEGITDSVNPASYTYDYDGLHRLTEERTNGNISATYVYNAIGNMTSKTEGAVSFTYQYNPARKHAVSNINGNLFEYDNNGNMISGYDLTGPTPIPRTITYNTDNMPASVIRGNDTTSFTYDGHGTRATKSFSGATTYYIGEHFEVVSGSPVIYIFAGSMRIAKKEGAVKHFFHKDHLGSSTVMTDANGLMYQASEYKPFGQDRTLPGIQVTGYKFTDQEMDSSTGLYDYGARLYDPVIGRFVTADSIVPNFSNPQSLNRYSYCLNNPLAYVDPSGNFPWLAVFAGALIGAVSSGAQSDWNPGTMAIGALIGGVSGGVGMGVSGLVGDGLAGGFLGGMAGGATAGGLSTAFYGGGAIENITRGAVFGAAAGFAFGAIGFPNTPWKVAAYGGIGGGLSALSGGDFAEGAMIASGIALAGYGYYKFTDGRLPTGRLSSGEAIEKPNDPQQAMTVMKKNPDNPFMGLAAKSRDLPAWNNMLSEQSLRWIPNNIPIFNDISFMHDFFGYKIFTNPLSWKTACWPSMVPAAAWTLAGVATYYAPYTTVIVMGSHSE